MSKLRRSRHPSFNGFFSYIKLKILKLFYAVVTTPMTSVNIFTISVYQMLVFPSRTYHEAPLKWLLHSASSQNRNKIPTNIIVKLVNSSIFYVSR